MTTWRHIFVFGLCLHLPYMITGLGCPVGWEPYEDNCFYMSTNNQAITCDEADTACKEMGANLTSIHSEEEQAFHEQLLTSQRSCIGLRGIDKSFTTWLDGTSVSFTKWEEFEPNNSGGDEKCVDISLEGQWYDVPCYDNSYARKYICKKLKAVCLETSAIVDGQTFTWPSSFVGDISVESNQRCDVQTERRGRGKYERKCVINERGGFEWLEPMYIGCGKAEEPNLADLEQFFVAEDNVVNVTKALNMVTGNITNLDSETIANVSTVLMNIVNVNSINPEVTEDVVEIVNNIHFAYEANTTKGNTAINKAAQLDILQALEQQITLTTGLEGNITVFERSIALTSIARPTAELNKGLNFIVDDGGNVDGSDFKFREENIMISNGESLPPVNIRRSSILMPASVFNSTGYNSTDSDTVGVSFFVQSSDILFPTNSTNQTVGGDIVSAVVVGVPDLTNLTEPVELQFSVNISGHDPKCVSWDFNMSDWTEEGCWLLHQNMTQTNIVLTCRCNHLTNFAVLVTFKYDIDAIAIDYISKIGCGISMITLLITIFIFLKFRRLRLDKKATPRQILLHLCVALFFLYFVFIVGIEVNHSEGCIVVAALLQFFTLASLMWMAVEARNMYLKVIRIFDSEPRHFVLKASIIAWGIPMLVTAISLGVGFHPTYATFKYYDHLDYCFVKGPPLYYGVILPVGIVMLHNFITFGVVMYRICHPATMGAATSKSQTQKMSKRLQNGMAISVLTGLTWAFGLFAIGEAAFVFSLIFSLCNSLQGFAVFYLLCFRQEDVRNALRPYFACMLGRNVAIDQQRSQASNSAPSSPYNSATNFDATIPNPTLERTEYGTEYMKKSLTTLAVEDKAAVAKSMEDNPMSVL